MRPPLLASVLLVLSGCGGAQVHDEPARPPRALTPVWNVAQSDAVLSRTMRVHVAPDLSHLTEAERVAVGELLAAGAHLDRAYLRRSESETDQVMSRNSDSGFSRAPMISYANAAPTWPSTMR